MTTIDVKENAVLAFCKKMPKIELHAHLNGSISVDILDSLISKKKAEDKKLHLDGYLTAVAKGETRTLDEAFVIFSLVQQLTNDDETVYCITKEVIADFAADNVKYLELRTTPRGCPHTGMTRNSYVDSVVRAIRACNKSDIDIETRLMLSIDRRMTTETAQEIVEIALKHFSSEYDNVIVGIDLSGDPKVGDARTLKPILSEAKKKGLKLALHLAEERDLNEETEELLSLPPDRLGHGTFLRPEDGGNTKLVESIREGNIPIECCLTSNIKCKTRDSYASHHFGYWYSIGHPCIISTDDKGIFCTTLSDEYRHLNSHHDLKPRDLWQLSYQSIDYAFLSEVQKESLRRKFKDCEVELFSDIHNV